MTYQRFFKPVLDIIMAAFIFLVLSTFFIIITFILLFKDHGSPFFLQIRPDQHGRLFRIIKFETVNDQRVKDGNLLPDSKRITKIGLYLSKTSIDVIPQLFNLTKGDLSTVGH